KTPNFRKSNYDTVVLLHLTEKLRNLNTMAPRYVHLCHICTCIQKQVLFADKRTKKTPTDSDD
ncbi:hypothetical protein KSS87_004904, partial [Heliosperma pusillum]